MQDIANDLSLDPLPPNNAKLEPFHSKKLSPGYKLAKYYFRSPGLSGSAGEGRLLYLIDDQAKAVVFLMVYSHKDYETRPRDDLIEDLVKEAEKQRGS